MKPQQKENPENAKTNVYEQTKLNADAFTEAENDIEHDADLHTAPEAGDDLDEGELARFEGEE